MTERFEKKMTLNISELFHKVKCLKAKDLPIREITPIAADTPLAEIVDKIGTSDLPIIPVINKKQEYIGIITLRDLLFIIQKKHSSLHEAFHLQHITEGYIADELININLPIVYDDDCLENIADIMSKFQTSVLPRAPNRKEQITGLIYLKDIFTEIRNIMRKLAAEEETCK